MTDPSTPIRVGLIGCGRIARVHLRYLRALPGVRVVGVADADRARAQAFAAENGIPEAFGDPQELLALAPDAVHVLTPPETHAALSIAALERGAHVIVEKPMATSVEAATRMEAAAHAAGRFLCVDHNRWFDPVIVKARAMIERGAIGTLVSVEAHQGVNVQEGGAAPTPETMWFNLGPHPLSLMRGFIGEILEWQAVGGAHGELRAVMKGTRALGTLVFSPATAPYLNGLVLGGTTGTLQLDLNTMSLVWRRERRLPRMIAKAVLNVDHALQLLSNTARTMFAVATRRLGTYPGVGVVIRDFYAAVASGNAPPVSAADGRAIVTLLEDLWQAATDARTEPAPRRRWGNGWLGNRHGATVLVTGAAGFLGRRVVTELARRGHRVRAMMHQSAPPAAWTDVEVVHAALGDSRAVGRALAGIRIVVHCAARVARRGTRAEFFSDNVTGTQHLLEAAAAAGVERFVHVSSIGIYGHTTTNHTVKENGGYDPRPELRGAYTWSKLAADRLVQELGRTHGLRTIVIRPGILVGPDGPAFTARLAIGPLGGRLFVIGRGSVPLPLCHVDDAARAIAAAVDAAEAAGPYNLVDPSLTQDEWLRGRAHNGGRPRVTYVSPALAAIPAAGLELVARLARRSAPTLSRYKIRRATEDLHYDTTRARRDLGWKPEIGVRALTVKTRALAAASTGAPLAPLAPGRLRRPLR